MNESFLPERLVMVDAEMTGVDETRDELLEAAFVKLEFQNGQYVEIGEPLVFHLHTDAQPSCEFHHKYLADIFKKCNESTLQPYQAAEQLHQWLGDWVGSVELVGDCTHTDVAFLKQNNIIQRNDIVNDEQVPGTFHYEIFELNSLKAFARTVKGEKYTVADLDENIHDALVDCRNQTKELNSYVEILLGKPAKPIESAFLDSDELIKAGKFKELAIESTEEVSPEEAHESLVAQKDPPNDKTFEKFKQYTWQRMDFPLENATTNGGESISEPMWSEGSDKPEEPWNLNKYTYLESKRPSSQEDRKYLKDWQDEYFANQYAELKTKAPPVFIVWDPEQNRYRFWNGRHRSRAAFLRGEKTIDAYVGMPKENIQASIGKKVRMSTKKRIKSAEAIMPSELPTAVRPAEGDDGQLPEDKKAIVESYNSRALRSDSFQDFQELLNNIMLDAQLTEDFRPSVAGLLNEYRVAEGYVAL